MDRKSDGRMYSRITRRTVAIIIHISQGQEFTINEVAEEVHEKKLPEFYLERFKRQMSISRTRESTYLRRTKVLSCSH